jgi:hypothetical protein
MSSDRRDVYSDKVQRKEGLCGLLVYLGACRGHRPLRELQLPLLL